MQISESSCIINSASSIHKLIFASYFLQEMEFLFVVKSACQHAIIRKSPAY